ncbi:MAG: hypothetical protein IKV25_04360 [Clostridia bacterium]|nr:hypothetical protein [Clostridia bacterium]
MKKFFSSIICSNGYCSTYNTIYKRDLNARVYIVNDGDDYERSIFFKTLVKNLRGYNISLFNPFYDESIDGIYIENLNTYILSDGGYNKISPILPKIWEKYISITDEKDYPKDLLREALIHKAREYNHYKNSCKLLNQASVVKERLHNSLSPYLDEDRIVTFIQKLGLRHIKRTTEKGNGKVRCLSSPTPLGIHTHYDTIFEICDDIINITDETAFVGAIILGVIKNYAVKEKLEIIASPSYFGKDFFQFLLLPSLKLAFCISDTSHQPPFKSQIEINIQRFFTDKAFLTSEKTKTLISVENSLLDKAVLSLYEGRDERFKYSNSTKNFSDIERAKESADKIAERILN